MSANKAPGGRMVKRAWRNPFAALVAVVVALLIVLTMKDLIVGVLVCIVFVLVLLYIIRGAVTGNWLGRRR